MNSLGQRIKYIREDILKLSQSEFAAKFQLASKGVVSNYESGRRKPQVSLLITLSTEAGVSLEWLLTGEGSVFLSDVVKEPSTTYGATKDELKLLVNLWDVEDARPSLLLMLKKIIERYELVHNHDIEKKEGKDE